MFHHLVFFRFSSLTVSAILSIPVLHAQDWPQWRGPNGDGASSEKGFPVKWSPTENIAWKVRLPGHGNATPIVWKEHIFVTGHGNGKNLLLCFDRKGKLRWQTPLGDANKQRSQKGSPTNSSPVTDGKLVFAYFTSGDLACVDFAGRVVWSKNLQETYERDLLLWDVATSPVLTKKFVVVACMQNGPSYVVALEKETGKQVWKKNRSMGASGESNDTYTTPVVLCSGDQEIIILLGADYVTSHNAKTGDEIWRSGGLNLERVGDYRLVASPVIAEDILLLPFARGQAIRAIKLGGEGDVTESHKLWQERRAGDIPSLAVADGKVFYCRDTGFAGCRDVKSGKEIWYGRIGGKISASPVVADGRLYVLREDGVMVVLDAGAKPKILSINQLGEFTLASPALSRGQIFIRGSKHLFCIGAK